MAIFPCGESSDVGDDVVTGNDVAVTTGGAGRPDGPPAPISGSSMSRVLGGDEDVQPILNGC